MFSGVSEATKFEAWPLKHFVPREWGGPQENCMYLIIHCVSSHVLLIDMFFMQGKSSPS